MDLNRSLFLPKYSGTGALLIDHVSFIDSKTQKKVEREDLILVRDRQTGLFRDFGEKIYDYNNKMKISGIAEAILHRESQGVCSRQINQSTPFIDILVHGDRSDINEYYRSYIIKTNGIKCSDFYKNKEENYKKLASDWNKITEMIRFPLDVNKQNIISSEKYLISDTGQKLQISPRLLRVLNRIPHFLPKTNVSDR